MLIVAVVSPFAFGVLFGPEWRDAGLYAAVLAPMNYFLMVFGTTGGILDVVERQDLHLAREVLRVVLMGGAVVVAAALHLPPLSAVGAVSIAGSLTYFLYGAVSWRAIGTHWSRAGSAGKALDG
jgi:O-antigen/teichoic acid export membrane protein